MTVQEATYYVLNKLRSIYADGEASSITDWLMEYITGSQKTERMLYKNAALSADEENSVKEYTNRLLQHEPLQYILQEAWFCGLRFYVDQNVLIPRPETEELVEWVISNCKFPVDELSILDIGTGSGCIPITLKRRLRRATVWAVDVSDGALAVAKKNAASLGVDVNFTQLDFLDRTTWSQLPPFDIIISNPPYIPIQEKASMAANVLQYEPHTALFVPDNDALIFYEAIAAFAKTNLTTKGTVYVEINESLGKDVCNLFQYAGFTTEIKQDMQEKERMIKAVL
jgi:release factor glutamine methyltransferase